MSTLFERYEIEFLNNTQALRESLATIEHERQRVEEFAIRDRAKRERFAELYGGSPKILDPVVQVQHSFGAWIREGNLDAGGRQSWRCTGCQGGASMLPFTVPRGDCAECAERQDLPGCQDWEDWWVS